MSERFSGYSAFFDDGASGLLLRQLRSFGTRTQKSMHTVRPLGTLDPAAHLLSMARPISNFQTSDLATVLGSGGVSLTTGFDVSDGATFMFQKRLTAGAFTSADEHVVQTVEAGFLHVTEISADAETQEPAQCSLEFIAMAASDGGNPFSFSNDDQAIPAALSAPQFSSTFYLGPAYYNAAAMPGLVRSRVRPRIVHTARMPDGGAFPRRTASSINARNPAIELTFLKLDHANAIVGDLVAAAFASTLAVYFQKGSTNNEGRVAAATAQHIKISAAAGSWGADDVSVVDENDATITIMVMPTGTLSLSAASAIP